MRSRELAAVALVVLAAACGASTRMRNDNGAREDDRRAGTGSTGAGSTGTGTAGTGTAGTGTAGTGTTDTGGGGRARAAGTCPARFGELGPTCSDGDTPVSCGYPEGTCSCETGTWCGGAAPPPMPLAWRCRPRQAACAPEGSPCSEPGARCTFDDCGFHGMSCVGGVWQSYMTPPPP